MNAEELTRELLKYLPDHTVALVVFRCGVLPRLAVEVESIEEALKGGYRPCGVLLMDYISEMCAEIWSAVPFADASGEDECFLDAARDAAAVNRAEAYGASCVDMESFHQA